MTTMTSLECLAERIQRRFSDAIQTLTLASGELTIELKSEALRPVCVVLRDEAEFSFELLLDVCGVDYTDYGISEWVTERSTVSGFSRGVDQSHQEIVNTWSKPRFGAVYHLLSLKHNQRLRLRAFAGGEPPSLDSVVTIWPAANWYEREAFDLYGIIFNDHPDLRRILTDYGFIGHPFRKDFPLTGHVEVRFDATAGGVIYEPVTVPPRTLAPKTIRQASDQVSLGESAEHA